MKILLFDGYLNDIYLHTFPLFLEYLIYVESSHDICTSTQTINFQQKWDEAYESLSNHWNGII